MAYTTKAASFGSSCSRDLAEPDKSGEEIAKFLAEMKFTGKVIVHSMNPTGAEFIRKILQDAGIPRKAAKPKPKRAATADEVVSMLDALEGIGRTAVALISFCGLRLREARGAQWTDYGGKKILIRRSIWRTHITDTKTEGSGTEENGVPVPVCEPLRTILDEQRKSSGFILAGPSGKPINLANLARRVVIPILRKKEIPWYGWYALRRGIATVATSVESPLAAKGLLGHTNVGTTQQFYIKDVPEETERWTK